MLKIFGTGSGQFRIVLRFGFDPGSDVFRFCCVFSYHSESMTNGTKKKTWFITMNGPRGSLF